MTNNVPHIETGALAKTLRECAELMRKASEFTDADFLLRLEAAAEDATKQAKALDSIQKQSRISVLGRSAFEVKLGAFPFGERTFPFVGFIEATGEHWGVGFMDREAAGRVGAAILSIALVGEFPETSAPPGEAKH